LTTDQELSQKLTIAIDGPAGAGKSTIAARLARKLGYVNLESGAMYRALALKAIRNDISFDDEAALLALAQNSQIRLEPTREGNRVFLDGMDVSQRIREQDVTSAASRVSVHPAVRQWMVDRQRELGAGGGVVMEGRDIGTKVFPHAEVKVFLDAHPEVRQERRILQRAEQGEQVERRHIAAELQERDLRDRTRAASPLVPAEDAVVIDSSHLSIDEVVDKIEELVRGQLRN
jgi:cytidylate kinase